MSLRKLCWAMVSFDNICAFRKERQGVTESNFGNPRQEDGCSNICVQPHRGEVCTSRVQFRAEDLFCCLNCLWTSSWLSAHHRGKCLWHTVWMAKDRQCECSLKLCVLGYKYSPFVCPSDTTAFVVIESHFHTEVILSG